jgi:archaellum component FlaC
MRLNQITEASFPVEPSIKSMERENQELELKIKFVNIVIEKYKKSIQDIRSISHELDTEVSKLYMLADEVKEKIPQGFSDRYNETVAAEIEDQAKEISEARADFIGKFYQGIEKLNDIISSLQTDIDENEFKIEDLKRLNNS